MTPPSRPSGAWAWPLVLAAALPLALLLADVVATLRGALDDATADVHGDMGLAVPPPSTTGERAGTALSGLATGPTLVVCALAVVALAAATVAGRGRWTPAPGSRWVRCSPPSRR